MDRRKLRDRVYLQFAFDASIDSVVQEHVIDATASILETEQIRLDERTLRRGIKNSVIMKFGWLTYLLWAWRIARLISFILNQYRQQSTASVTQGAVEVT